MLFSFERDSYLRVPLLSQTTNPNHQFTISWSFVFQKTDSRSNIDPSHHLLATWMTMTVTEKGNLHRFYKFQSRRQKSVMGIQSHLKHFFKRDQFILAAHHAPLKKNTTKNGMLTISTGSILSINNSDIRYIYTKNGRTSPGTNALSLSVIIKNAW